MFFGYLVLNTELPPSLEVVLLSLTKWIWVQATQHQHLMYMAGQLGLDPPTMSLVPGGAASEMAQALKNCKAVGEVFTQPFMSSVLSFTVYCSLPLGVKGIKEVEGVLDEFLSTESSVEPSSNGSISAKPLVLYILLPALPKGYFAVSLTLVIFASERLAISK